MKSAREMVVGEAGSVSDVRIIGDAARRVADMGLTRGASIKLVGSAPLGDPLLFEVRGFYMAVRKRDADKIFVIPNVSAVNN